MFTPPDGSSPRMQMYLFSPPSFPAVSGSDDASVVYHEYTHGLSSRLVTDANGFQALNSAQAGAMGEGWSDWYAMDYLVGALLAPNAAVDGDVTLDRYVGRNLQLLRSEGLDCPVGSASASCPGKVLAGSGGYTYGDFGRIFGSPEVHADGEIWGQTLWDLRTRSVYRPRGPSSRAQWSSRRPSRRSSTCAMPSCRQTRLRGAHVRNQIWQVFADARHGLLRLERRLRRHRPYRGLLTATRARRPDGIARRDRDELRQRLAGRRSPCRSGRSRLWIRGRARRRHRSLRATTPFPGSRPGPIRECWRRSRGTTARSDSVPDRRRGPDDAELHAPPGLRLPRGRLDSRCVHRPELLGLRVRSGRSIRPVALHGLEHRRRRGPEVRHGSVADPGQCHRFRDRPRGGLRRRRHRLARPVLDRHLFRRSRLHPVRRRRVHRCAQPPPEPCAAERRYRRRPLRPADDALAAGKRGVGCAVHGRVRARGLRAPTPAQHHARVAPAQADAEAHRDVRLLIVARRIDVPSATSTGTPSPPAQRRQRSGR